MNLNDEIIIKGEANYSNFVEIFNQVFPEIIEQRYIKLANDIINYIINARKLGNLNSDLNASAISMSSVIEKQPEVLGDINALFAQIRQAIDKAQQTLSVSDAKLLPSLADEIVQKVILNSSLNRQNENQTNETMQNLASGNDARKEIEQSVSDISTDLTSIQSLDTSDRKRIEGLGITNKHLEQIDSLNISWQEKQALATLLYTQFNARVAAFKTLEQIAPRIILAYNNRQLLEGLSEEEINKCDMAVAIIQSASLKDPSIRTSITPIMVDRVINECSIVNLVTDYLNTGTYDAQKAEEINSTQPQVDYRIWNMLMQLQNKNNLSHNQEITR